MSIEFHDPRGEARREALPYTARLGESAEPIIGLLANGFPDSVEFLEAVENALNDALPAAQVRHYNKNGASIPAKADLISEITNECDAVITAYGH